MKLVRTVSLAVLAVALGVGFLATGAQADTVLDSVRVVLPDSNGLRGIDSLITTEIYFRTSHSDSSNINVYWWLATKADTDGGTIVADGSAFSLSANLAANGANTDLTGTIGVNTAMVAVKTTVDISNTAAGTDVVGDMTMPGGTQDTVIIETTAARTWKVTIKYTVDAGISELSGIAAYAAVEDTPPGLSAVFTAPKAAQRGHDMRLDGQRPVTDPLQMAISSQRTTGAQTVLGFTGGSTPVLSTGDTVVVGYNLGPQAGGVLLTGDLLVSAYLNYTGSSLGSKINLGTITNQIDSAKVVLQADAFGDVAIASTPANLALYLSDRAGNLSSVGASDVTPVGLSSAVTFLVDTKAPALDAQVVNGDTILPVANDTISDGGVHDDLDSAWMVWSDDLNPILYNLPEALFELKLTFDNADNALDQTYVIPNDGSARTVADYKALSKNDTRRVDLPNAQARADSELYVYDADTLVAATKHVTVTDTSLATGRYTISFQGTDVAGNTGAALSRANVYVDVTDPALNSLFPTKLAYGPTNVARTDTIEEITSQVNFQLAEPVDSLLISYRGIAGTDNARTRTRRLSGTQLTNTSAVQTFTVDSLRSQSTYVLAILARDLAGNYSLVGPDTFRYDTSFVVPIIKRFRVAAATNQSGFGHLLTAATTTTDTLIADATTNGSRDAVTYKGSAILKVQGGGSVTISGTGVTDLGGGRALLDAASWLAGRRVVSIKDSVLAGAQDTLRLSLVDSTTAGGPYPGALDSSIVYTPGAYSKLVVSAPSAVPVGSPFNVTVRLSDAWGNRQIATNNKYVMLSANRLGVQLPAAEVYVANGQATFQATATMDVDSLVIRARDVAAFPGAVVEGVSGIINVGAAGIALDAPDTLIAADYMGADGAGDQGGFVMLTWELSADHASLDGYRVYRQIQVETGLDSLGNVITLSSPQNAWMPWAMVDAVPGETIGRAIVATLDNVSTLWAIAAERGGETTAKEAFDGVASVNAAYELMAGTMAASKAAVNDIPFATLTPEALSFIEKGVAPRMRSEGAVAQSALVQTVAPVRAIDNIAPAPVAMVRAMDTPNDAGASVTVTWSKSISDRQVVNSVPTAVGLGSTTYTVDGVAGYNVYRKVGEGAYTLVGQADPGQTSFADVTALNGVRYTYKVSPFDLDNVTETTLERSAMAVRNNAVDAQGVAIRGLFGMDNQVDFDDFFAFADNFGLTAGDEAFEPAFDLVANARIDFEDFFAFADNFGRVAVGLGKVVPTMAGLNTDARLLMTAGAALPKVGEEVALQLSLADFRELKGYGFTLTYDANKLEFVKVVRGSDALGSGELATPQILSQKDGEVNVGAFGEAVSEGELGLNVVFRTKTEIEESFVEVSTSAVRDGNYAINQVALPAPVQIQTRPDAFALKDNYPNPFNPATTIKYALPEGEFVKLEIYNVVGQVVRTLVSDHQNAGRYAIQWDATNDSGHSLSSGIYFYRLQAGSEFTEVKKMLLLK